MTETVLINGRITTLDPGGPTAIAIDDGIITAVGDDDKIMALRTADTRVTRARLGGDDTPATRFDKRLRHISPIG